MKTKIDWKNHLIELIVVFAGITGAFALENWSDYNSEREMEQRYLSGLFTDAVANIDSLNSIIASKQSAANLMAKGRKLIGNGYFSGDSLSPIIQTMAMIETFKPRVVSYESLMNSGGLETITNFDLRNMIVEVNNSFDYIKLADDTHVYFIKEYIVPYFFNHFSLKGIDLLKNNSTEQKRLSNLVVGFEGSLNQEIIHYKSALNRCMALRDMLQKEIAVN